MKTPKNVKYAFKIVIAGSGGVGKTALFNRYCFNSFNLNTAMTIGINFHSTYLKYRDIDEEAPNGDKHIVNSIFDFGGQERFKPLIPRFLDGANGALLVFDSVSYSSFQQLEYWHNLIEKNTNNIPKILVGSKSDLLDKTPEAQIVREELINEFIEEKAIEGFYRTSALENYNVLKVFKDLTKCMLKHHNAQVVLL